MRICSKAGAKFCTAASPRPCAKSRRECAAEPELLAHHFTQAGLTEAAIEWWGRRDSGRWSVRRWSKPRRSSPAPWNRSRPYLLRPRCVASRSSFRSRLITPLIHVKGFAAPETKAGAEQARLLIEQAEALGEPPEDPLLLFSVLYGFWVANIVAFNGDVGARSCGAVPGARREAKGDSPAHGRASPYGHFLAGYGGHRGKPKGISISAFALYDPGEHRPLATRFGQDARVSTLSFRSLALWLLGYPEAALETQTMRLRMRARSAKPPR